MLQWNNLPCDKDIIRGKFDSILSLNNSIREIERIRTKLIDEVRINYFDNSSSKLDRAYNKYELDSKGYNN